MKNIFQLLKPGGWLQWREILPDQDLLLDPQTLQPVPERLKIFDFVEKHMGFITFQDWSREMPKYFTEEGGFVDADVVFPEFVPALINQETQLLLWNSLETVTTLAKAVGTQEAKEGAKEAMEDTERHVREGKVLHWKLAVGFARRPE